MRCGDISTLAFDATKSQMRDDALEEDPLALDPERVVVPLHGVGEARAVPRRLGVDDGSGCSIARGSFGRSEAKQRRVSGMGPCSEQEPEGEEKREQGHDAGASLASGGPSAVPRETLILFISMYVLLRSDGQHMVPRCGHRHSQQCAIAAKTGASRVLSHQRSRVAVLISDRAVVMRALRAIQVTTAIDGATALLPIVPASWFGFAGLMSVYGRGLTLAAAQVCVTGRTSAARIIFSLQED
jgi:hypothetical protein